MANLNRIILIGTVANDPEGRITVDGVPMTKFRLEVDRFIGSQPAQGRDVFDIVSWRNLAEVSANFIKKGQTILVEGQIQIRTYQNEVGAKKWATEIVAKNLQVLSPKIAAKPIVPAKAVISETIEEDTSMLESEDLPF